jgi:tRNA(Ile)-lysidine synthase TilS/MesJ
MIKLIKQLLPPKDTPIYFALSMGVDSLAAYLFLRQKGYKVAPLHFNHCLRDQNCEMEEQFYQLSLKLADPTFRIGCSLKSLETENNCREARFEFFGRHCSGGILVTAHHLDDYVESYLLNCFRGQPEYRPIKLSCDFPAFKVVHPFLLTEKQDFVDFMDKSPYKQYVVNDESNKEIKGSRRNWIRNVIVPEMLNQKISLKKRSRELIKKDIEELDSIV